MEGQVSGKKTIAFITNILSFGGLDRQIFSLCGFFIENGYRVHVYSVLPEQLHKTLLKPSEDLIIHYPENNNTVSTVLGVIKYSPAIIRAMLNHYFSASAMKIVLKEILEKDVREGYVYKKNNNEVYSQLKQDNTDKPFEFVIGFNFQTIPYLPRIKSELGINVKYIEISSPQWRNEMGMIKPEDRLLLENIDDIIVPSDAIGKELLECYNLKRPYFVLPLFLKLPPFISSEKLGEYPLTFGVATRLSPGKNQDLLIQIISIIKNTYNLEPIKLVLVGSGTDEKKLRAMADNLDLHEDVIFLGYIENILDFINQIGVVVLLSDVESVSATLLESLYFGKPIIATDVGATKDIVKDGINGYLINDKNALDDIAYKIISILSDREKYFKMSRNSRYIYDESYTDVTIKLKRFFNIE